MNSENKGLLLSGLKCRLIGHINVQMKSVVREIRMLRFDVAGGWKGGFIECVRQSSTLPEVEGLETGR